MRTYSSFILANENEGDIDFENYREAFAAFQRCEGKTTLYGVDELQNTVIILTK